MWIKLWTTMTYKNRVTYLSCIWFKCSSCDLYTCTRCTPGAVWQLVDGNVLKCFLEMKVDTFLCRICAFGTHRAVRLVHNRTRYSAFTLRPPPFSKDGLL